MSRILVLNGPNLNLLGTREPHLYGHDTLAQIEASSREYARHLGLKLQWEQSNHEGVLIDHIHDARSEVHGLIINPAGFGHTSVALRDALLTLEIPIIEVHLTNPAQREEFRRRSLTADVAIGQICGFGSYVYHLALNAMAHRLTT